ncbi:phospholipase A2 inhibitor and Ly6/PLAUR domain-containing protein-like [Anomaloglossus baeobatrachus]|uniref:phospholipase A2 inhibitor and Ly6/PLAUR domain-containing protein-like n=1 Tax=Anomaloglossus baeobatrachus TaxID=238106 RepID=UPI003F5041FA
MTESMTECLGDQCMTACQYAHLGEDHYTSIMKGCANATLCGANGLGKAEKFKFKFYVNCCSGNLCNTDGYYLPKEDPTPNGVTCPSAYCNDTMEECEADEEMECTGSMVHCFDYREHVINEGGKDKKYSMKGCINPDSCKFSFDTDVGVVVKEKRYAKCYDP